MARARAALRLADVVRELPRRAHDLPRRTVVESQRWRILEAMTEVAAREGYAGASVADVIAVAGVSRRTFYEQFTDKEDCFVTAYDAMSARFAKALVRMGEPIADRDERIRAQLGAYLAVLARDPAIARAYIVEVLGAGPRALARREKVNATFGALLFGAATRDAVLRKAIVGGVNDVVVGELLEGRGARLPDLLEPIAEFVRRALATSSARARAQPSPAQPSPARPSRSPRRSARSSPRPSRT